jgi:hypothetical protein
MSMVVDPSGLSSPPVVHESGRRAALLVVLALVMVALTARVVSGTFGVCGCSCAAAGDVGGSDDDELDRVELTL